MRWARGAAAVSGLSTLVALCVSGCSDRSRPFEIRFVEVAVESGLDYQGPTYAAAAADVDGNGWPDLAISNHGEVRLYRNLGNGTFAELGDPGLSRHGDTHGVSWIDLDDNGRWDVFVSIGAARGRGVGANRVYLNNGGELAADAEVDPVLEYQRGRGRCACPVDVDGDGRLELALMNAYQQDRGQRLARHSAGGFTDIAPNTVWAEIQWECVVVIHIDDSGEPVYLAGVSSSGQPRAYRRDASGVFRDVTEELGLTGEEPVSAMVPGDFDNDGDLDLYLVTGGGVPEGVETKGNDVLFRLISHPPGVLKGFRFTSSGNLEPTILLEGRPDPKRVLLGRGRVPLADAQWAGDPLNPVLDGQPDVDLDRDRAVFLWRDDTGVLTLWFAGDPSELWETSGRIESESGVDVLERQAVISRTGGSRNRLFKNQGGWFEDVTDIAGVGGTGSAVDAVFADFDNDGDLDLYVVNGREPFTNPPDTLFQNNGDGTFTDMTHAAGLGEPVVGRGDGALAFDYDRDGDVDVLTTNGRGPPPGNIGPYRLWRNESRSGGGVAVGLSGAAGNRPAFGTQITGKVGRRNIGLERFASNGRFSTSILPFHIGLGSEDEAFLTIRWPSGVMQEVHVMNGDEVTLVEPE